MPGPNDIQAPWIGHSREEYFGYDDEPKREYDEDAEYEHYHSLQYDEAPDGDRTGRNFARCECCGTLTRIDALIKSPRCGQLICPVCYNDKEMCSRSCNVNGGDK